MKSDTTQMDLGIKPKATAEQQWQAYQACRMQFPHDERRKAHYLRLAVEAEAAERQQMRGAA